tara:strand:- start:309 stop:467 length:159 start_codon:yes stop_codon:yes gene_type:complete
VHSSLAVVVEVHLVTVMTVMVKLLSLLVAAVVLVVGLVDMGGQMVMAAAVEQ